MTKTAHVVPIDSLEKEDHSFVPEFWAVLNGREVFVTAVLERTLVYVDGDERKLGKRADCLVDPAKVKLVPTPGPHRVWRRAGKGAEAPAVGVAPVEAGLIEDVEVDAEAEEAEPEDGTDPDEEPAA